MKIKIVPLIVLSLLSVLTFQKSACSNEESTQWEDVKMSMTELLNNGWQITNQGSNRAFSDYSFTSGRFRNDIKEFTFLLTKSSNHIICLVENPNPGNAKSRCRKLN
jgi:hypothetical protein